MTHYRVARGVAWVDSVEGQSVSVGSALPAEQQPEAWMAAVPGGEPLSLNGSGLAIWLACAAGADDAAEPGNAAWVGHTAEQITDRVRAATGQADVPVADVTAFLVALVGRGLLFVVPG